MELKNKIALVTGAGSGMGAETARVLAKKGVRVILMDVQDASIARLLTELKSYQVYPITCDVADEQSVETAFVRLEAEYGLPSILVNCAGIVAGKKVISQKTGMPMPLLDFKKVIDVNLIGTFNILRCAAAAMSKMPTDVEGERGVIISVASIAAFEGQIGQVAYSASKGGIVAMTLPLAREFATLGIRVMTIAPGLIDTPMMASLPELTKASLREDMIFPNRLGLPLEFVKLVLHIIDNRFLNGEVIRLDGAVRLSN